jgi:hypothetical protein
MFFALTSPLALLVSVALALGSSGCTTAQLGAAVVDYPSGQVEAIVIHPVRNPAPAKEPTMFYNPNSPEGQRAARDAAANTPSASFTYALAHNVALRLNDAREAFDRKGLPLPRVIAVTEADPAGVLALGTRVGRAFRPLGAPVPAATASVRIEVTYDVDPADLGEEFTGPDLSALYPSGNLLSAATIMIDQPSGRTEHWIGYVRGQGLSTDPAGQLISRIADHLAPTELASESGEAPLAYVHRVHPDGTLEVDLGLDRERVTVTRVHDLTRPLKDPITASDLERVLEHQYVRLQTAGGPEARAHALWRRVEVAAPPR